MKHLLGFTLGTLALVACGDSATQPGTSDPVSSAVPLSAAASDSWIVRADMPGTERFWMTTATVTNSAGESILYVIGGKTAESDCECNGGSLSNVQAYNVATNTWTWRAPLPRPLYSTNGTGLIKGKIYVSGGVSSYRNHRRELYVYDPAANTWSRKRDMPLPSWRGVTGVINNQLYVLPGCAQSEPGDCLLGTPLVFYRYNPVTDHWSSLPAPPSRVIDGVASVIGGKLYVVGGFSGTVDVFNPVTNQWISKTSTAGQQVGAQAFGAAVGGKLYVMGGWEPGSNISTRWNSAYDPVTDSWTSRAPLPSARHALAANRVVRNGQARIEVVGGTRPGNNLQYIP
jgi:N-acetylneuraminic acid mutarotase